MADKARKAMASEWMGGMGMDMGKKRVLAMSTERRVLTGWVSRLLIHDLQ